MKTQEITVAIKATVPMGKYCINVKDDEVFCSETIRIGDMAFKCRVFGKRLMNSGLGVYKKCQDCMDACANGTERALKELAE